MQSNLYERFSWPVILGEFILSGLKVSCHVRYKPRVRFILNLQGPHNNWSFDQSFLLIKQWNFMAHFLNNIFELVLCVPVLSCWSDKTESWLYFPVEFLELYIFLIGFVDLLLTKIKLCTSATLGFEIATIWKQIVWVWKKCLKYT